MTFTGFIILPAPTPQSCEWCAGELPDCGACGGTGVAPAEFDLPRSRTLQVRKVKYVPECRSAEPESGCGARGRLSMRCRRAPQGRERAGHYTVKEIATDWRGRGFEVCKHWRGEHLNTKTHHVFIGSDGVMCDCEGGSYQSAAKANQDAHEVGDEVFATYGCVHADALVALMLGGWLDIADRGENTTCGTDSERLRRNAVE